MDLKMIGIVTSVDQKLFKLMKTGGMVGSLRCRKVRKDGIRDSKGGKTRLTRNIVQVIDI